MRRVLVVLSVLLLRASARADEKPLTPEQAADAVLSAVKAKDDAALSALAGKDAPDPWDVADALCARQRHDAAAALARAVPRKDTAALAGYAASRAGKPEDPRVPRAREALAAAKREPDPQKALAILDAADAPLDEVVGVRIAQRRGAALQATGRGEEGGRALAAAGEAAQRMGWFLAASTLLQQGASDAFHRGDFRGALATWEKRLEVEQAREHRLGVAATLANFGLVYRNLGDFPKALSCLERGRKIYEEMGSQQGVARALMTVGNVHRALGDYAKALSYQERALALMEKIGDRAGAAYAAGNLGNVYKELGDLDGALAAFERARRALEAAGDRQALASVLVNTALVHEARGDLPQARALLDRALAEFEATGDRSGISTTLQDVGSLLAMTGDAKAALEANERALKISEELGAREGTAAALVGVGFRHRRLGEAAKALSFLDRGAREAERIRSAPILVEALCEMAWVYLQARQPDKALAAVRRAMPYVEGLVRRQDEEHGAGAREQHADLFAAGAAAAADLDQPAEAAYFLESGRAGTLMEALGDRDALQAAALPEELRAAEAQARAAEAAALAEHAKAIEGRDRATIQAKRDALDGARRHVTDVIERIQRTEKAVAEVFYPRAATLEEMQAWLSEGDALVLYGFVSDRVIALAVTKEKARIVPIGTSSDVEAACAALTARDGESDTGPALEALEKALVAPLRLDEKVKRLLVSPDGAISFLPFAAFVGDREVVCVPSGTTYGLLREERAKPGESVLALGDPDYGAKPEPQALAMAQRGMRLVPLPATRLEANAVGDVVLLGKDASEAGLRDAVSKKPRWRAVHFACHGLVDPEKPALSSLALTPSGDDDGFLKAADVFRMKIPADLVVLSACETGKGKIVRAEGVVGLTRAFMFAGAPRVVVSLWKVDDEATRALMTKFYERWKAGTPTAKALKEAQEFVKSQEKWKHPYYWAAWVLWGLPD